MREKNLQTILIDNLDAKASGIGRGALSSEGRKIRVPKTLPGEEVDIEKISRDGGRLLRVLKGAEGRVEARCPHFSVCGGCQLQHLEYQRQLDWKQELVKGYFSGCGPTAFYPILGSFETYGWRNKMEFSFSQDKYGHRYLGLVMEQERGKVFNVERCYLAPLWMSELLQEVRLWWEKEGVMAYNPYRNTGALRGLILREGVTTKDRLVMLHLSGNSDYALSKKQVETFKERVLPFTPPYAEEATLSLFLLIQQAIRGQQTSFYEMHLWGREWIREKIGGKLFLISPRSFFQPHTLQAIQLYQRAVDLLDLSPFKKETVYDLYCGTATLGIMVSSYAKEVIGVDISKEACLDARLNLLVNGIDNVTLFNGDVAAVLQKGFPPADVVMVDPPRIGLSKEAIGEILKLNPKKILYISCQPKTCAINVLEFIRAGYNLVSVQPVDQFPHTYHVETISLLIRSSNEVI